MTWRHRVQDVACWSALLLLLAAVGAAIAVTNVFAGSSPAASGASSNGTATSLQTVTRRSLTSQTQVDGTLGYADSSTVSLPAGTAPSSIRQAEQTLRSAQQLLATAQATLTADRQTLAQAQAQLTADRLKEQSDCAGANAAQSSAGDGRLRERRRRLRVSVRVRRRRPSRPTRPPWRARRRR